MNILITGTTGGLGRWLAHEAFPAAHTYNRHTGQVSHPVPATGYDLILHTAQGARPTENQPEAAFIAEHISLAQTLLAIPHKRFVLLSSIDVTTTSPSPYSRCKQALEALFLSHPTTTILRPAALFGPGMRRNASMRMALEPSTPLTLSAASTFAFTHYSDIAAILPHLKTFPQTITLASQSPYTLAEWAKTLNTAPTFGTFTYTTPIYTILPEVLDKLPALTTPSLTRLHNFLINQGYL